MMRLGPMTSGCVMCVIVKTTVASCEVSNCATTLHGFNKQFVSLAGCFFVSCFFVFFVSLHLCFFVSVFFGGFLGFLCGVSLSVILI